MPAHIAGRKHQLIGHNPNINRVHVLILEVQFAVLAAGPGRKCVKVSGGQLIDVSHRVDVRQLTLQYECANDEGVVSMDVVAASRPTEGLIAEHAHPTEGRATCLIGSEVKARVTGDDGLWVSADV